MHLQLIQWGIQNASGYNSQSDKKHRNASPPKWTRDISDLVLIIYGCAATDCFDYGTVDIKEIAIYFSKIFGVEIKDSANIFRQIRKRKIKDRTAFFDEMKAKVIERMDNADNGVYTYRKGQRKK